MKYIENLMKINSFYSKISDSTEKIGNDLYKITGSLKKDSAKLIRDIIQWFIKTKGILLSAISRKSGKLNKWVHQKDIVSGYSKILKNTSLIVKLLWKYIHKVTKILWKWGNTVYIVADW